MKKTYRIIGISSSMQLGRLTVSADSFGDATDIAVNRHNVVFIVSCVLVGDDAAERERAIAAFSEGAFA